VLIFIFAPSRSSSSFCHRIHHRLRAVALIIVFVLSRLSSLLRRCAHLIIALSSAQASLRRQALKLHCDVKRSSFIALSSTQASLRPRALKNFQCAVKCSSFLAPSCAQASSFITPWCAPLSSRHALSFCIPNFISLLRPSAHI
jgi:hypothetical protein